MALFTCPECGKEISDKANICPSCGYPILVNYTQIDEKKDTKGDTSKAPLIISVVFFLTSIILASLYVLSYKVSFLATSSLEMIIVFLMFASVIALIVSLIKKILNHTVQEPKNYGKIALIYLAVSVISFLALGLTPNIVLDGCVDNEFKADIVDAVSNRLKQGEKGEDYSTIIASEEARLGKYRGASFRDSELCILASKYLYGLECQKSALGRTYSDFQCMWETGTLKRYEALVDIQNEYGLFSDIEGFDDAYTYQLGETRKQYDKLVAVNKDLESQLRHFDYKINNQYELLVQYTNNTEYTFSLTLYIDYKDSCGVRIYSSTDSFFNIQPNSVNEFRCYFPLDEYRELYQSDQFDSFSFNMYWEIF